jgi:hypothetical protein
MNAWKLRLSGRGKPDGTAHGWEVGKRSVCFSACSRFQVWSDKGHHGVAVNRTFVLCPYDEVPY